MKSYNIPMYRIQLVKDAEIVMERQERISSPAEVLAVLQQVIGDTDREHFVIAMLDLKNKVIGVNTVSIGSINSSIVHPREVFKPAILVSAASVILCHNHPSGDPSPSSEDLNVTKRIREAGDIIGIKVLDHIILGDGEHFSFKEKGLI